MTVTQVPARAVTQRAPKIALVCTTIGRWPELGRMLESAASGRQRPDLVVIVDQSHESAVPDADAGVSGALAVPACGLSVIVVRDDGLGISRGRNVGINEALGQITDAGDWVIGFPDDDVWFDDETLIAAANAFTFEDRLDVVSGWLAQHDGTPSRAAWPTRARRLTTWTIVGRTVEAATFVRATVFSTGLRFNPAFGAGAAGPLGSGEGVEFLSRVIRAGFSVGFDPSIAVFEHPPTVSAARGKSYAMGEGAALSVAWPPGVRRSWRLFARPLLRPIRAALRGRKGDLRADLLRARYLRSGARYARQINPAFDAQRSIGK